MTRPRHPALTHMRSNVAGITWPPIAIGPAAGLAALVQQLDESQWLPRAEIERQQFLQIGHLARHAEACSPHFRRRLEEANLTPADLGTLDGLARLPVLTRRMLQTQSDSIYCASVPEGHGATGTTSTSGSTGEPVVVRRTGLCHLGWLAMTLREHLWHGRDFCERLCAIRANIARYGAREDWGPPASLLFETGPSIGIPITADVAQQVAWIEAFDPNSLLVYPSTLAAITRHVQEHGNRFSSLEHIRTMGETLPPAVRAAATTTFGVRIADFYSSQEFGYLALQCPDSDLYHTAAETHLVEVLDDSGQPCGVGQVGRVTVTDLHNFATPLIRYDIGDYAEVGPSCGCGRGLPTLSRIVGRERNLIVMPDGTRHWPLVGFAGFRDIAPINQYQFIQHDRERIEVRLVAERGLSDTETEALREHVRRALGHAFTIEFEFFDGALPTAANGKFEEFVCRLPT